MKNKNWDAIVRGVDRRIGAAGLSPYPLWTGITQATSADHALFAVLSGSSYYQDTDAGQQAQTR